MRLVYESNGREVKVGDLVKTFRGDRVVVTFFREPHKPSSSGKVCVKRASLARQESEREYGVGVIGAKWIDREDQKVCPVCDMWADSPSGDCINRCKAKGDA